MYPKAKTRSSTGKRSYKNFRQTQLGLKTKKSGEIEKEENYDCK